MINQGQRQASDPFKSAWVQASAGSGKTKVLVDRIINLLLQDTPPEQILCLTYTKAAACEMSERLVHTLKSFVVMEKCALSDQLSSFSKVNEALMEKAKNLFFILQQSTQGVRFMTLHSFCQALLDRFPLEAGLPPGFSLISDEEKKEVVDLCISRILQDHPRTLHDITRFFGEYYFKALVMEAFSLKGRLGSKRLCKKIYKEDTTFSLDCFDPKEYDTRIIPSIPHAINQVISTYPCKTKGDQALQSFFSLLRDEEISKFSSLHKNDSYVSFFLTSKGEVRKKIISKAFSEAYAELDQWLKEEAWRLYTLLKEKESHQYFFKNALFFDTVQHIFDAYDAWKETRGLVDFDDLIIKTLNLLDNPSIGPHVLFKTDQRFDHVLMDEAQDTSPLQWQVVRAITQEFCKEQKTVFAVGDAKQSIYSFQDAHPKSFVHHERVGFMEQSQENNHPFLDIELNTCYRCAPEILRFTDAVFRPYKDSLYLEKPLKHHAFKENCLGSITLHPLIKSDAFELYHPWEEGFNTASVMDAQTKLADTLASLMRGWLDQGKTLSDGETLLQPTDMMILLKRRSNLMALMARALRRYNIPVSANDGQNLNEQLPIMDLLALAKFSLQPHDDLNLACLLKSSLFHISEEMLFTLCHNRPFSLWQRLWALHEGGDEDIKRMYKRLRYYLKIVDVLTVQQFFSHVLFKENGFDQLIQDHGLEAEPMIQSFLTIVLNFTQAYPNSMLGFLNYFEKNAQSPKRQSDKATGVRLLTTHGAKGLQAPIVFLADANDPVKSKVSRILFHPKKRVPYLNLSADSDASLPFIKDMKNMLEEEEWHEHARLLYVALTRAEENLHIFGIENKKGEVQEKSWYEMCQAALHDE
jgi:ATP-dependent helicase/nuclease subunit A